MAQTVSGICFHVVFPTRGNAAILTGPIVEELHGFLDTLVKTLDSDLLAVGSMPDHLHMLVHIGPGTGLSRFVERVKLRVTYWAHASFPERREIDWDPGYCAFTVTAAQTDRVAKYITTQAQRHQSMSYQEELRQLRRNIRRETTLPLYS